MSSQTPVEKDSHFEAYAPNWWSRLVERAIHNETLSREEALQLLRTPDDDLLLLLNAAFKIRRKFFGKKVRLNMILNAKSGLCPEDCAYCAQSRVSTAPIEKYPFLDQTVLLDGARRAKELGAGTYCIVASGRGPTDGELERVTEAVQAIKQTYDLTVCACLGILDEQKAKRLKAAGVDRYNHNLNTSEPFYEEIVSTHTYADRLRTIEAVQQAGISSCSGFIIGMGEHDEDIVEMAFQARALDIDSIPINFLHPIPGTPLGSRPFVEPMKALKVVAMFRFINPTKEIRVAGGREETLRSLQPLLLYAANSIFIGDYLTTSGQEAELDRQMIADMGFVVG
ncbi:MAG: biotin synthase BioB [Candidatus Carbobacillus altaicus]|nr:biotin synthase BioB [Candidatus Carbobacillus altaicus]